jgi:hypothetical protein
MGDAFVTTATDGSPRFFARPSIAHLYAYVDDQTLEERRGTFFDGLQQLRGKILALLLIGAFETFSGRLETVSPLTDRRGRPL